MVLNVEIQFLFKEVILIVLLKQWSDLLLQHNTVYHFRWLAIAYSFRNWEIVESLVGALQWHIIPERVSIKRIRTWNSTKLIYNIQPFSEFLILLIVLNAHKTFPEKSTKFLYQTILACRIGKCLHVVFDGMGSNKSGWRQNFNFLLRFGRSVYRVL